MNIGNWTKKHSSIYKMETKIVTALRKASMGRQKFAQSNFAY